MYAALASQPHFPSCIVGGYSGLDSFVRNSVYLVFVLRSMNLLEEQDTYWVVNNLVWSWLLLPALAMADVIKQV